MPRSVDILLLALLTFSCSSEFDERPIPTVADHLSELERSCASDDANKCADLAMAHTQGFIAPFDLARAARLWNKACARGHAYACGMLGNAYERGEGVRPDLQMAKRFWARACAGKEHFPDASFACAKAASPGSSTPR